MIISIQGKGVGGMTTVGVEIELELGGPDMVLLVSRYKFGDEIREFFGQAEKSFIHAVDAAINDDRLLGWTNICAGTSPETANIKPSGDAYIPSVDKLSSFFITNEISPVNAKQAVTASFMDREPRAIDEPNFGHEIITSSKDLAGDAVEEEQDASGYCSDKSSRHSDAFDDEPMDDASVEWKHGSSGADLLRRERINMDLMTSDEGSLSTRLSSNDFRDNGDKVSAAIGARRGGSTPIEQTTLAVAFGQREWSAAAAQQRDVSSDSDIGLGSETGQDDCTDDGNAWCGCVCGQTHEKSDEHNEIFWIQCDSCSTWYDSSSRCLGFSQREVDESTKWVCEGCDDVVSKGTDPSASSRRISPPSCVKVGRTVRSLTPTKPQVVRVDDARSQSSDDESKVGAVQSEHAADIFVQGDLVYVDEHAWPGVNNPEGIAKVLIAYVDDDGDLVYDICYIVGGKKKGVLPEYLHRHVFS